MKYGTGGAGGASHYIFDNQQKIKIKLHAGVSSGEVR